MKFLIENGLNVDEKNNVNFIFLKNLINLKFKIERKKKIFLKKFINLIF
jgi:hypothetical protein